MSHEIRTPLNGVLAVGQMLAATPLNTEQRDMVATINDSGETLLALICDILDFSRIEAQKLILDEKPYSLEEAMEKALNICCVTAAHKRINITVRLEPDVPRLLVGDVGRLQQVLLNCLANGLKFTPDGGCVQARAAPSLHRTTCVAAHAFCEAVMQCCAARRRNVLEHTAAPFQCVSLFAVARPLTLSPPRCTAAPGRAPRAAARCACR